MSHILSLSELINLINRLDDEIDLYVSKFPLIHNSPGLEIIKYKHSKISINYREPGYSAEISTFSKEYLTEKYIIEFMMNSMIPKGKIPITKDTTFIIDLKSSQKYLSNEAVIGIKNVINESYKTESSNWFYLFFFLAKLLGDHDFTYSSKEEGFDKIKCMIDNMNKD